LFVCIVLLNLSYNKISAQFRSFVLFSERGVVSVGRRFGAAENTRKDGTDGFVLIVLI
jgi:hypothetical protein